MGFLQKFRVDRRGVGWVLGVAFLSILLLPIVYFPLDYAFDQVLYWVTSDYVFTGVYASSLVVVKIIIDYLLIFGLLFTINYAVVQAKQARYEP